MSPATFRGWTASSVPIGLWIAHLTALASLTRLTCERSELTWIPHALTVGLALGCVPFLVMSAQLLGETARDETEGPGDLRFLGWMGLAMSGFSALLIVAEGLVVFWVGPCL
jgi:hypothetical protein